MANFSAKLVANFRRSLEGDFQASFAGEYRQIHFPPKLHRKFHHQTWCVPYPDLPFLAFLEFLVFFLSKEFLAFFSVFPFFPRDFRGSLGIKNPLSFGWFSLPFSKIGCCQRTTARKTPALSTWKCSCQKLANRCPTLGQLLASRILYALLVGDKQYEIAKARFCTQSCSKVDQLLVNSSPTPHPMGSCRGLPCSSPLATPNKKQGKEDQGSHQIWRKGKRLHRFRFPILVGFLCHPLTSFSCSCCKSGKN